EWIISNMTTATMMEAPARSATRPCAMHWRPLGETFSSPCANGDRTSLLCGRMAWQTRGAPPVTLRTRGADPDMLQVGNGGMRQSEYRVHFSLWAIMKAPLLIGCDLSAASNEAMSILSNKEVIAVNQDSLGVQARKVQLSINSQVEVWSGPLSDDRQVVALVNRGARSENVTVSWKTLGLNVVQRMYARDLWKKSTLNSAFSGEMSARVASHDVRLFVIWPAPDV
ncbi:unnamed protein product, partial [Closterium sp. Naga37s-1]